MGKEWGGEMGKEWGGEMGKEWGGEMGRSGEEARKESWGLVGNLFLFPPPSPIPSVPFSDPSTSKDPELKDTPMV